MFRLYSAFVFLILANFALAQPGPFPGGPRGPGGPGGGGPRHELKFSNDDVSLFKDEAELKQYNEQLEKLKTDNPESFKKLSDDIRKSMPRPERQDGPPGPEVMQEMKKKMAKALKEEMDELNPPKAVISAPTVTTQAVEEEKPKENPPVITAETVGPPLKEVEAPVKVEPVAPSLETKVEVSNPTLEAKVETPLPVLESKVVVPPVVEQPEIPRGSNRNYKPETCEWVEDIPRRIVKAPGCSKEGSRLCTGYVVCEQKEGGGKFVRMSTCSEKLCGSGDAIACTKQRGFDSWKPQETEEAISREVQK